MNRSDYMSLLDEIMHELKEEGGTFADTFGKNTPLTAVEKATYICTS